MSEARRAREHRRTGAARRTYGCLEAQQYKPSDYRITTTQLLYYPERGFELPTPVCQHYLTHQSAATLRLQDWDGFEDPAQTTYSSYVAARRDQEAQLDRAFAAPSPFSQALLPLLGPVSALRFPLHALQMVAAYVGALAPGGRIAVAAAFQAMDELCVMQRLCQWLWRSQVPAPELDALGRELWQQHPAFQPLRRCVERLLVNFDWDRALIELNGAVKPAIELACLQPLLDLAKQHDDEALKQILKTTMENRSWHHAWFTQLLRHALQNTDNAEPLQRELEACFPRALEAGQTAGSLFAPGRDAAAERTRTLAAALERQVHELFAPSATEAS